MHTHKHSIIHSLTQAAILLALSSTGKVVPVVHVLHPTDGGHSQRAPQGKGILVPLQLLELPLSLPQSWKNG